MYSVLIVYIGTTIHVNTCVCMYACTTELYNYVYNYMLVPNSLVLVDTWLLTLLLPALLFAVIVTVTT